MGRALALFELFRFRLKNVVLVVALLGGAAAIGALIGYVSSKDEVREDNRPTPAGSASSESALPKAEIEPPKVATRPADEALPPAAAPDDRRGAWERNAVSVPLIGNRPMIAVIIDDLGLDVPRSLRTLELQGPLTLAWLSYADHLPERTALGRARGHELLLHVPMEPEGRGYDPGPNVLSDALEDAENLRRLRWALSRFEGYIGINNHMGSRFTSNPDAMGMVLGELQGRGLAFIDSRTSGRTVGARLARDMGMPYAERNIFLDDDDALAAIQARLRDTEKTARRQGYAVAIGHPREETLKALEAWLPAVEQRGFALVPVSAIIRRNLAQK